MYLNEVLLRLRAAHMTITNVDIFFVGMASRLLEFKFGRIEDRHLLKNFDKRWEKQPEGRGVKVRALEKKIALHM